MYNCTHLLLSFRSHLLARTIVNLGRVVPSSRFHTMCLSQTQNLQKFLPLCDHWACGCPTSSKPNPAAAVSPHGGGRVHTVRSCPLADHCDANYSRWWEIRAILQPSPKQPDFDSCDNLILMSKWGLFYDLRIIGAIFRGESVIPWTQPALPRL